jgi:hypothetical protein
VSEPLTNPIQVTIDPPGVIQQTYLGGTAYVVIQLNDDTEQFDVFAGGGIKDLDEVKMVVGYVAEALDGGQEVAS